jgi:acyl carrier protein
MEVKKHILDTIQKKYALAENVDLETFNYLDSGFVDSIGIIQFVVSLEDDFDIEFTDADMNAPSFRTIGGLIRLVEAKIAEREKSG